MKLKSKFLLQPTLSSIKAYHPKNQKWRIDNLATAKSFSDDWTPVDLSSLGQKEYETFEDPSVVLGTSKNLEVLFLGTGEQKNADYKSFIDLIYLTLITSEKILVWRAAKRSKSTVIGTYEYSSELKIAKKEFDNLTIRKNPKEKLNAVECNLDFFNSTKE